MNNIKKEIKLGKIYICNFDVSTYTDKQEPDVLNRLVIPVEKVILFANSHGIRYRVYSIEHGKFLKTQLYGGELTELEQENYGE